MKNLAIDLTVFMTLKLVKSFFPGWEASFDTISFGYFGYIILFRDNSSGPGGRGGGPPIRNKDLVPA